MTIASDKRLASFRAGISGGLFIATIYAAFAVVVFVTRGPEAFGANRTSLQGALLTYYSAGLVAGGLTGILVPLCRNAFGLLLICLLDGFIAFACITVAMHGPFWIWTSSQWTEATFLGMLFGLVGFFGWRHLNR